MIYLIKCGEINLCKIGYSYNVRSRLSALQTSTPYDIKVVSEIDGDIIYEKHIHKMFNHLKVRGEWFKYTDEIIKFFNAKEDWVLSSRKKSTKTCNLDAMVKTLSYILLNYKKESQFEIGGATRRIIAENKHISVSNVANALTELKSYNIIYSPHKSLYTINPRFAYQGSTNDRYKALKSIIELGCKDC